MSVNPGNELALRVGPRGLPLETGGCRLPARAASRGEGGRLRAAGGREQYGFGRSLGDERPTQNWYGQGESDCLIKTKHCDGPKGC